MVKTTGAAVSTSSAQAVPPKQYSSEISPLNGNITYPYNGITFSNYTLSLYVHDNLINYVLSSICYIVL